MESLEQCQVSQRSFLKSYDKQTQSSRDQVNIVAGQWEYVISLLRGENERHFVSLMW